MHYEAFFDDFLSTLDNKQRHIVEKSYGILLENISFNYECDISVDNTILVVGENPASLEFCNALNKSDFSISIKPYIDSFSGTLGNFKAIYNDEIINVSQIVFFIKPPFLDSKSKKSPQMGIHLANEYKNAQSIIHSIAGLIGDFTYENTILYDKNRCQYHHRDKNEKSYCYECEQVCPTFAITKDTDLRELHFSNIDCIFCGKCVSVCPSGAMQKANAPLSQISKAAKQYSGTIPLIMGYNELESNTKSTFSNIAKIIENTPLTPFIVPNINLLNEVYLLSILQESGTKCVIVGESCELLTDSIAFVNNIYNNIFGTNALYCYKNYDEIDLDILSQESLPGYHYQASEGEFSREIFSNRLRFFIKDSDFGTIPNNSIKYSDLEVSQSLCTLCMSCVESCNTRALIHSKDKFELLLNPSFCTTCGICVDVCPEKAIKMTMQGIALKNDFFTYNQKAKDEPFKCVECGKIFASAKSIEKVANIMEPLFQNDEIKKKSLFCCSDCKVKILFA